MRILQVNSVDSGGGAAKVAWNLFQTYRQKGHESWLVAGGKFSNNPFVRQLNHDPYRVGLPGLLARLWKPFRKYESNWPGLRMLHRRSLRAVDTRRIRNRLMGFEDYEFPGTAHLLDLIPERPDVLHLHNLHGDYFDLRELSFLSHQHPVVLTLHDAWLLSGHCAHSFECERWKIGCGYCPDLTIPPPVRRDATAFNWLRKQEIFSRSRLRIATPCRWLMQKVEEAIIMPAILETRVIPNGVDLSIFKPVDKISARSTLGIQPGTKMILFTGNGIRKDMFRDYTTLRSSIDFLAKHLQDQKLIFIGLGESAPAERSGQVEIRFMPYQNDPRIIASYYQAADVFIHASRADTFPTSILESLASGTPVVATAVGGIPEQISDGETGFLVRPGDAQAMAVGVARMLDDDDLRQRIGRAAVDSAHLRFDLARAANDYLTWYDRIK